MDGAAIARLLASSHRGTRGRAVRSLRAWLYSADVTDADLLKAWKGLFYCFWHSDGAAAQSSLSNRIASLLLVLPVPLAGRFLDAALATLHREWPGIDLLRLDKFYLFLRLLLRHLFLLLRSHSWDPDLSARFLDIFMEKSLLSGEKCPSRGIGYHFAEIFLDELKDSLPLSSRALDTIIKPFVKVVEKSQDKVLVNKVKVNIFGRLLDNGSQLLGRLKATSAGAEADDEVDKLGKVGLVLGLGKKFFQSASAEVTSQRNRKALFKLHEGFFKLEKDLEKSGFEITLPATDSAPPVGVAVGFWDNNGEVCGDNVAPKGKKKRKEVVKLENAKCSEIDIGNHSNLFGGSECDKGSDEKHSKRRKVVEPFLLKGAGKAGEDLGVDSRSSDDSISDKKKKKKKKVKKDLNGIEEKGKVKKKKKKEQRVVANCMASGSSSDINNGSIASSSSDQVKEAENIMDFDKSLISNLQKQFEKIAEDSGLKNGGLDLFDRDMSSSDGQATPPITPIPMKRQRSRSSDRMKEHCSVGNNVGSMSSKTGEKSIKKVTFSMKNNLVWKPYSPLPPQSLRLPPAATPRGSALKRGVPPGPIKEIQPTIKKVKRKTNSAKKVLKNLVTPSPAVKRLMKLQSLSI